MKRSDLYQWGLILLVLLWPLWLLLVGLTGEILKALRRRLRRR